MLFHPQTLHVSLPTLVPFSKGNLITLLLPSIVSCFTTRTWAGDTSIPPLFFPISTEFKTCFKLLYVIIFVDMFFLVLSCPFCSSNPKQNLKFVSYLSKYAVKAQRQYIAIWSYMAELNIVCLCVWVDTGALWQVMDCTKFWPRRGGFIVMYVKYAVLFFLFFANLLVRLKMWIL